ncbi:MAG: DUF2283 domain-containing protein [Candidatus Nanohaloarchaea archaeon]|nr:DUF2283 domain-containing protein [Candidatus Nanohaloarchaea archaeon]
MVTTEYNADLDILTVDVENRSPEEYDRSIPIGDYIIDVADDGTVLGVEVLNAAQNLPYTKTDLEKITGAELDKQENGETGTVTVALESEEKTQSFTVGYPASA